MRVSRQNCRKSSGLLWATALACASRNDSRADALRRCVSPYT